MEREGVVVSRNRKEGVRGVGRVTMYHHLYSGRRFRYLN